VLWHLLVVAIRDCSGRREVGVRQARRQSARERLTLLHRRGRRGSSAATSPTRLLADPAVDGVTVYDNLSYGRECTSPNPAATAGFASSARGVGDLGALTDRDGGATRR